MADNDRAILPEQPGAGPLGRHLHHDPGNRNYPIRELLPPRATQARIRPWWNRPIFDQQGSSCTMQAAVGLLVSVPFRRTVKPHLPAYDTEAERHAGYLRAQGYDPWEGGEPTYAGSSTDAPLKMLREDGVIREWRWCFGLQDALDTVRYRGPVAVGTWWLRGMDTPDARNRIHYTGERRGGHAWVWEYVDEDDREIVAVNSWGKGWGRNGRVRVPWVEADKMLGDQGEAVTVVA